jgi:hypothetical protein
MSNPSNLTYTLSKTADGLSHLAIYDEIFNLHLVNSEHTHWNAIVTGVMADDDSVLDLIDIGNSIARTFLSDRITYTHNSLFFDGDEIAGELIDHILRSLKEHGHAASKPLINFLEKVQQNPSQNSRNQLYSFLQKHEFTINEDGNFIGYKGVHPSDNQEGGYQSHRSGPAIINGVPHRSGVVRQKIGDIVEMQRSIVVDDPNVSCSTGLHVSNWRYASQFSSTRLAVEVNPRDVVSVPSDSNNEKIRVCRYKVIEEINTPHQTSILIEETSIPSSTNDNAFPSEWAWDGIKENWYSRGRYEYDHDMHDYMDIEYGLHFVNTDDFEDDTSKEAVFERTNWAYYNRYY